MKIRILGKFAEPWNQRLGRYVHYERGDILDDADFTPDVIEHLLGQEGPRDGSEALGKLVQEHAKEWEKRDADGKRDWREPAWFRKQKIPLAEYYSPRIAKPKIHRKMPPKAVLDKELRKGA